MADMQPNDKETLNLWLSRFKRWEGFVNKGYRDKWDRFYKAYRCHVEDRNDNLSNLFLPFIFSMVETIEPRLVEAFFGTKPWTGVLPQGPEDIVGAKAQEDLIQFQLEERMGFLSRAAEWLKGCLIYGTGIGMVTWKLEQRVRQKLQRVAIPLPGGFSVPLWSGVQTVTETTYDDNWFDHIDLGGFFFEPRATDVDGALYCGHLSYENWAYLKQMEGQGFYRNLDLVEQTQSPEQSAVFRRLNQVGLGGDLDDSQDKQGRTYELMHCFEDDRYTVICNREVVIRDGPNPYYHKRKPYVKIVDIPVMHEFYGMGEVEPTEFLQYALNDLTNAQMDYVLMSILGVFLLDDNSKLTAEDLRLHPRKILRVSEQDNLRPWAMPNLNPASFTLGDLLKWFMENAVGAGDVSRGMTMSKGATATEVSTVQQMAESRFRLKVRLINNAGIRSVARLMALNNQQFVRREKAIRITGAEGYQFPKFTPEMLQGNFDFIPAGVAEEPLVSKENRRNNMMQLYQIAKDDPMFKQRELRKRVVEVLDVKDVDAVLKTEEELAQEAAQQAQMQAAQAQAAAPAPNPQPMPGVDQMMGGMMGGVMGG